MISTLPNSIGELMIQFGVITKAIKMPKGFNYIYGLVDPETKELRYIGKSCRPKERLTNHCNEQSVCHRTNWLKSLKRKGLRPLLIILDRVHESVAWQDAERKWIAVMKEEGHRLTNSTDGGDGVPGLTGEGKERMQKTWIGRKHKPESLIKIGNASKGRTHTEEYKQMMCELMSQRIFTEQHRQRLSVANMKFTGQEEEVIRRRLLNGEKVCELANEYKTHRTTITKIKLGKYRKSSVFMEAI